MKKFLMLALFALLALPFLASAKEARLIRYPHYQDGRVTFSYLGDIWVANEDGTNIQRLTVNRARDVYSHFSSDSRKLYFTRNDSTSNSQASGLPSIQLFSVALEYLDRDPDDPEERAEAEAAREEQQPATVEPADVFNVPVIYSIQVFDSGRRQASDAHHFGRSAGRRVGTGAIRARRLPLRQAADEHGELRRTPGHPRGQLARR